MSIRMQKPWIPLTEERVEAVGGQLGVYELADRDQHCIFVGKADGRSLFGLRGELNKCRDLPEAHWFRYEVNTAYLTRYQELLMVWMADHGTLPLLNKDDVQHLGRLQPGGLKS